jgi:[protein-PII] uridylyltransferase
VSQSGDSLSSPESVRNREAILAAKEQIAEVQQQLHRQHESGSAGIQICARQSDLWDENVLDVFERAVLEVDRTVGIMSHVALVPLGGYGRRDVAPYSDVDLLLLHETSVDGHVETIARRLVADLSDVGIKLGFSVRTPRQAVQMARRNPVIFTSQVEARYLAGSVRLFRRFDERFRRDARRRTRTSLPQIERSRMNERSQFGGTTYLLEPDIKRTVGGLRDLHFLRWIGFARFGEAVPANLCLMGVLRKEDERTLRGAHEFLLRLRNELHFHAGRSYDVLNRAEQLRIAGSWGYEPADHLLPVQQFMRDYFRHTSHVQVIVDNFLSTARMPSMVMSVIEPILSHRMDKSFLVGPTHISATKEGLLALQGNLTEVLRLMVLANQMDKRIAPDTWKAIRDDMMDGTDMEISDEASRRFMSLLSYTARLGRLLRRLHELRVLEKFVAGLDHARYLLQFNQYHKYTVDEHSFQCVESATGFSSQTGTLGDVYRSINNRDMLHLALLIHDLGKGHEEDHCVVGKRLAKQTAQRLRLPPVRSKLLQFLVEKHLLMAHLAFRRDTSDPALIHRFANDVGTPETLRMLYVLTAADLAGVGPGVLNPWKIDVLTSLYQRTLEHLVGDGTTPDSYHQAEQLRSQAEAAVPTADANWYRRQLQSLPATYLAKAKPQRVIKTLSKLRKLRDERVIVWGRFSEKRNVNIYNVGLHQRDVQDVFHRLIGVLTQNGMEMLAAYHYRLADDVAFVRFFVDDHDFQGAPPKTRFDSVSDELAEVVDHPSGELPSFRQVWRSRADHRTKKLESLPTRVEFDNTTLSGQTIIDMFAHNRVDLIYVVTRILHGLGVRVNFIKSGTYLDQVVYVFYVTDAEGEMIEDDGRLSELRLLLLTAVENE